MASRHHYWCTYTECYKDCTYFKDKKKNSMINSIADIPYLKIQHHCPNKFCTHLEHHALCPSHINHCENLSCNHLNHDYSCPSFAAKL